MLRPSQRSITTPPSDKDIARLTAALVSVFALALAACGGGRQPGEEKTSSAPEPSARPVILCVGTSLTEGLGLVPEQAFPALLQAKVDAADLSYRVVNAGVSGETSAGALRRMDWLLGQKPAVMVLEAGANDGLRGQNPESTRANIQAIFDRVRQQSPPPRMVLVGMQALPNYGPQYSRQFRALYPELALHNSAALVPFILEGVAGVPTLNQSDGLHPTAAGHKRMAENVWRVLQPLLEKAP